MWGNIGRGLAAGSGRFMSGLGRQVDTSPSFMKQGMGQNMSGLAQILNSQNPQQQSIDTGPSQLPNMNSMVNQGPMPQFGQPAQLQGPPNMGLWQRLSQMFQNPEFYNQMGRDFSRYSR